MSRCCLCQCQCLLLRLSFSKCYSFRGMVCRWLSANLFLPISLCLFRSICLRLTLNFGGIGTGSLAWLLILGSLGTPPFNFFGLFSLLISFFLFRPPSVSLVFSTAFALEPVGTDGAGVWDFFREAFFGKGWTGPPSSFSTSPFSLSLSASSFISSTSVFFALPFPRPRPRPFPLPFPLGLSARCSSGEIGSTVFKMSGLGSGGGGTGWSCSWVPFAGRSGESVLFASISVVWLEVLFFGSIKSGLLIPGLTSGLEFSPISVAEASSKVMVGACTMARSESSRCWESFRGTAGISGTSSIGSMLISNGKVSSWSMP